MPGTVDWSGHMRESKEVWDRGDMGGAETEQVRVTQAASISAAPNKQGLPS